jgi:hypothetical protein
MRQLVALIVDVFAERDLPVFLFTLVYDKSFREALDRSLEGFPEVLGRMLRPLRMLHELVAHAVPRHIDFSSDIQALKAGVTLLFEVNPASLAQLPEPARHRLFQVGCDVLRASGGLRGETLAQLHASLSFAQESERGAAAIDLAEALVAAGEEAGARKWLDREFNGNATSGNNALVRFRESLDRPRVGLVALEGGKGNGRLPPPGRWYRGWHLLLHENVLVRVCRKEEQAALAEQIDLLRGLLVHGVSRLVGASVQAGYVVVELPGAPLYREAKRAHRVAESTRLRWAVEICALLESVAAAGVFIADANLSRFNVDQQGHLWLVDVWPMQRSTPEQARAQHLQQAQLACKSLVDQAPCYTLGDDALQRMQNATSLGELAAVFQQGR